MKKIITNILLLVMILPYTCMGISCNAGNAKLTQMQVDLNPSVEFMLDKNNKVVSVTALNDDGAIIIYGETFVGLSADEAVNLFVNVCSETGYLVSGEQSNNELNISLSCDTKQAKKVYNNIKESVNKFYTEHNINGKLAELKTIAVEDLKNKLIEIYPDLANTSMTKEDILAKLDESRKETKHLICANLRNMYYDAKDYELQLTENQKVKDIIALSGDTYSTVLANYDTLLTKFDDAVKAINDARVDNLLDENSGYQKALKLLLDQKEKVLEAKKRLAELQNKESLTALENLEMAGLPTQISVAETALNGFEYGLTSAYTLANGVIDTSISLINIAKTELTNFKNNLPTEISTNLTNQAKNIEAEVNAKKSTFFDTFQMEYNEQLEYYSNYIAKLKQDLKAE